MIGKYRPPSNLSRTENRPASSRRPSGDSSSANDGSRNSFESGSEPGERDFSDDAQSPSTDASSTRSAGSSRTSNRKANAAVGAELFAGRDALVADVVDNQRANHVVVTNPSANSSTASLSLASASFGDSAGKIDVARDRLLANIAGSDAGSGSAGVVAGCAFGSYSNTTGSGLTVTGFGGSNGPTSFMGTSFSKLVGGTLLGTTIMPLVNASSKTEVTDTTEHTATVTYKASRDATLFVSGSAAFGAAALSVRFGVSRRNETRVIRTVSKNEAQRAQKKSNTLMRRTVQAMANKMPLAVPDLRRPLGDANDPKAIAFGISDEVQTVLRGTMIGGVSVVAGNIHIGANAAISGEMELAVRRMPDNEHGQAIMRVGLAPKRVQAANVSIDLPLLGVADATMVRAQLMRSVWDLNLATEGGRAAYDGIMTGRLPSAPVQIDASQAQTAEANLQTVRELNLPEGVSLVSLESSRIDSQVSFGAAVTAPAYIAAGKFGKVEIGKSRLDASGTIGTAEQATQRRERQSGWRYELLSARGADRSIQVIEERTVRADSETMEEGLEGFTLQANLRFPRQTENTSKKVAQFLDEQVLLTKRFDNVRFYGRETRDALSVSIGRAFNIDDVERLIGLGAVDPSDALQLALTEAAQNPSARYDVLRQARERLAKQVLREGPAALGRLHRLLADGDEKLTFALQDTTGARIDRKAKKYAVQFFAGLQSLQGDALQKATKLRVKKIGGLMQDISAYRTRLERDPVLTTLLSPKERDQRQAGLDGAADRLAPLVDTDGLSKEAARTVLLALKPADNLRLLDLQNELQPRSEKKADGDQASAADVVRSS